MKCMDNDLGREHSAIRVYDSTQVIKTKKIPVFYKECILAFQELSRVSRKRNSSDILWFNDLFKCNGMPLFFKHWVRSGITSIQDLIQDGQINENAVFQKLSHKAGFIFEISMIKSSIPFEWKNQSPDNEATVQRETNILEMEFNIPNKGNKPLNCLTSRDVYDALLLNKIIDINSKQYWIRKFENYNINWEEWFIQNSVNKLIPKKCRDFNWKIFHGLLNTEMRLKKMKYSNGICKMCDNEDENAEHLLYKCTKVFSLWKYTEHVVQTCVNAEYTISDFHKIAYMDINYIENSFINMLLTICRWSIWKRRNINRYEGKYLNEFQSMALLKNELKNHMIILSTGNMSNNNTKKYSTKVLEFIAGQ